MRHFNTAGPCRPDIHYMLPAAARVPGVRRIIDQQAYFVLHAPRQSGKTTAMMALARELTEGGGYAAVVVSAEVGAIFGDRPGAAELAMLADWRDTAEIFLPRDLLPPPWPEAPEGQRIRAGLKAWSESLTRPLVLLLDEIDSLKGDALLAVLRQLRSGYAGRPLGFPHSLALIGLRDVRDYKIASGGSDRLHTSSPFNIKVESLTIPQFSREDVSALYGQHTADTGQVFTSAAVERAYELTQGQPWLVNALARQAVEVVVDDVSRAVDVAHIDEAKEILIRRQDTHLDSLAERLREPRVRRVLEPMMAGLRLDDIPTDDIRFVLDLGLCSPGAEGGLVIANPIYREVMPRVLAEVTQSAMPQIEATWLKPDGALDAPKLLHAFLAFWRRHGQPLLASAHYTEIAPHLVMMAFLHRVCNGGGTLEREYAIGTGRMDMVLRYGSSVIGMELKVWRDGEPDPKAEGLEQIDRYLSGLGPADGWLVLFDRRTGIAPISTRTTTEPAATPSGREVTVIRA